MSLSIPVSNVTVNSPEQVSDESLVLAAKDGDANAFAELRNRHSRKILRTTYRITGNREDAEDALQDSLLKAFIHLNRFEGRSSFSTWVTRIAINTSLMTVRKRHIRQWLPINTSDDDCKFDGTWEPQDLGEDPERRYARHERAKLLGEAMRRLSPTLRTIMELQQTHGYSTQELAESLGISVGAAKSRLLRARLSMRTSLQSKGVSSRNGIPCNRQGVWQGYDHHLSSIREIES